MTWPHDASSRLLGILVWAQLDRLQRNHSNSSSSFLVSENTVSLCKPRTDLDKAGLKLRDLQALHAAQSLSYRSASLSFCTYFPANDLLMRSFRFPFSKMVRSIKAGRSLVLDVPPKSPEQHRVHVKCLMDVWLLVWTCRVSGWRVGTKMSERAGECVEDGGMWVDWCGDGWRTVCFTWLLLRPWVKGKAVVLGKVVLAWKLCFFSQRDSSVVQLLPDERHDWPCCGYRHCIWQGRREGSVWKTVWALDTTVCVGLLQGGGRAGEWQRVFLNAQSPRFIPSPI